MATYRLRLKDGMHILADKSKPLLDPETGKPTGRFEKEVVKKGGTFDSDTNLANNEPARYELVGAPAEAAARIAELEAQIANLKAQRAETPNDAVSQAALASPSVAPGGQVSSGFQVSTGSGSSGAMTPEQAATLASKAHSETTPTRAPRNLDQQYGPLDSKPVRELKEIAEAEEIDLTGSHSKDEIIKAIRAAR